MNVIIIGCGRVGADLAYRLFQNGHQVTVVDQSAAAFERLPPEFRGRTVEGEALFQDVLHRAGIEHADALAAVTSSDAINAVIAHVARTVYHVPNVAVRNFDPKWRTVLETFGLQLVSPASWGAQRLEELLYHAEIRTVFSAGNGEVEVYEFMLPEKWAGRTLQELFPHGRCHVVAVTRAGRALLPAPETRCEVGDVILVSATLEGIEELRKRLLATQ